MWEYLQEINLVEFNFAPEDWALCDGKTLSISGNEIQTLSSKSIVIEVHVMMMGLFVSISLSPPMIIQSFKEINTPTSLTMAKRLQDIRKII